VQAKARKEDIYIEDGIPSNGPIVNLWDDIVRDGSKLRKIRKEDQ